MTAAWEFMTEVKFINFDLQMYITKYLHTSIPNLNVSKTRN